MKMVELTNAGSLRLDKMAFAVDKIECIQKPQSDELGCIIVVNGQRWPVKELYEDVKKLVFG